MFYLRQLVYTVSTHTHREQKTPKTPETTFFLTGPSYDPTFARSDCGCRYASPLRCCLHPARNEPVGPGSMGERKTRGKGEGVAPSQDASDHCFFYYIFRLGNPNLNLNFPLLLGGGPHPKHMCDMI